jgi:hypothetical protein
LATDGQWIDLPASVKATAAFDSMEGGSDGLGVFSAPRLGLFRITSGIPASQDSANGRPGGFNAFETRVRLARAAWHLIFPVIALATWLMLSMWFHRISSLRAG